MSTSRILSSVLSVLLILATSAWGTGWFDQPTGPVPGKFIVKLSRSADPDEAGRALERSGEFRRAFKLIPGQHLIGADQWERFYVFRTDNHSLSSDDVANLVGRGNVEYVEQDHYIEWYELPDDPLFEHQWYLLNTGQDYFGVERIPGIFNDELVLKSGTPGADIRMIEYYAEPPPEHTQVVVAIVDTGVDPEHPELQGQFWNNPDEIPDNGIDDDHNGYIDDVIGYDFAGDDGVSSDNYPNDLHGHGTHCAGIVAARADGVGVVGVAPNARIMAVSCYPGGTVERMAEGVIYAASSGADIINGSWGSPSPSILLEEAMKFARANNVFVSLAAGNDGTSHPGYPAAYDSSFVVAASNSDGYMTNWTTWGPYVDVVAPGEDILSLRADGTDMYGRWPGLEPGVHIIGEDSLYYLSDGTSMSAPVVCGAAALILAIRPDMTVFEVENTLCMSATDMVDPFNRGDNLPGPDSLSGYGQINVDAALALLSPEGLTFLEPVKMQRYTDDVIIKVKPTGGYEGSWSLDFSLTSDPFEWRFLAAGKELPRDSVLAVFRRRSVAGPVYLRLTDKNYVTTVTSFLYVRKSLVRISSPVKNQEAKYNIAIYGTACGPDFDSVVFAYSREGQTVPVWSSTAEFYDTLVYVWSCSDVGTGPCALSLTGYFGPEQISDEVDINILSGFMSGWPQRLPGEPGTTPISADMNHDGTREIIAATSAGLCVFHPDGSMLDGFPAVPEVDIRCVPAVYDTDRDGEDEIICTNRDGLHVFNYDGTYADGFPQACSTGSVCYSGLTHPNPVVAKLGLAEDSAILFTGIRGRTLAYEFNGDSYFYSLQGLFSQCDSSLAGPFGGGYGATATSADINADGLFEVLSVRMSSVAPYLGLAIWDGRTGQPAYDPADPVINRMRSPTGMTLADLNGDGTPETITCSFPEIDPYCPATIDVKTNGVQDLPGWPRQLPETFNSIWIGMYPIAADLDLDGVPEILCVFISFYESRLYIFQADGSTYNQLPEHADGIAYYHLSALSMPTVADLTGDEYPEIIMRSGFFIPGIVPEQVHILDYRAQPIAGSPLKTTLEENCEGWYEYLPYVDDVDGDNMVELLIYSENNDLLIWDFDALYDGTNRGRFLQDNLNSNYLLLASPTPISDNYAQPELPAISGQTDNAGKEGPGK